MLFALGILATATCGALLIIANSLRTAPEAYEDEHGFHIIQKRARGAGVFRTAKSLDYSESGSLKGARVNPL
jgi:hypothetical protein